MFLNEEEQSQLFKKNSIKHKKRNKFIKNNNYLLKSHLSYINNNNEEPISLTEHSNILNEYGEELKFLSMKRKNINPKENLYTFKECQNNNSNINISLHDKKRGKNEIQEVNENYKIKKNLKKEEDIKMSQLFNLYHYLFMKSGLDCTKLSRFVDYLSNEIKVNEYNSYKDYQKITFEEIKKKILNLNNEEPENVLINNIINQYFHCNFKNSIMEKILNKINKLLINKNNNSFENKTISINNNIYGKSLKIKKDKSSYSNLLIEKLNNTNCDSCLSLSNDSEFFKSIIYFSNKLLFNKNKSLISDKTVLKSLEDSRNLLSTYKEENNQQFNQKDKNYLNDILVNKKLRRYIKNKLIPIKKSFNNKFLNNLDKNNFNKIINLIINNKIDYKNNIDIFNDFQIPQRDSKKELNLFKIILYLIFGITITYKYHNYLSKSDLTILNPIFQHFKQADIFSILNLQNKKKVNLKKIKKKENNKIKIKIDINESFKNSNDSLIEEKIIEDSRKENQIIKIVLDSNDFNENKNNNDNINTNEPYINGIFQLKIPTSNQENRKDYNKKDNHKENSINFDLMERNNNIGLKLKKKLESKKINFHKKLLKELSKGNDIFKLNIIKLKREKEYKKKDIDIKEIYNGDVIKYDEKEQKIKHEENFIKIK